MTSLALADWNGPRRQKIGFLWSMHAQMATPPKAQIWQSEQALAMVVQRMATEFQGHARALHDEAVEKFITTVASSNSAVENVLRERMTSDRALDRGNAHSDAVKKDFARIGLNFWPTMAQATKQANQWEKELKKLIEMRNGVAHDDNARLTRLQAEGYPLDVATLQSWHVMLDGLTTYMDDVVSVYLAAVLRIQRPW